MESKPLVSILVPNFNYGRYLDACLGSALDQTYENLQVVFVDNHSTDDSYDIAMEYRARYPERLRIYRNDQNIGGSQNHYKAYTQMDPRTRCSIYLSSDDLFHPTLVQRAMDLMNQHPSVGFVILHRSAIDEQGRVTEEVPFYNCNCVIPSTGQMEVFMMAGVGVSTQCFRNLRAELSGPVRGYRFDVAGDWYSNFCLACVSDMGYIRDPLCLYRTHATNVTTGAIKNLTNSVEHILLIHAFHRMAQGLGRPTVAARLAPALEKLGSMCLRYCTQMLQEDDLHTATRYLHLATVLRPDSPDDPAWNTLFRLTRCDAAERRQGLAEFLAARPQKRLVSYDPPAGSIIL